MKDKANSDSNSQHLNKGLKDPVLSSFPTYLLEKDTLRVLVLGGRDLARTSFKARIATPLKTDSLTP
jgi:hypothetical protein